MSDEKDDDLAEIVTLPSGREAPVTIINRGDRVCGHRRFNVNQNQRRCVCKDCGAELDPYAALETLAKQWDRWEKTAARAQAHVEGWEKKKAVLDREEKRLKARLSRLRTSIRKAQETEVVKLGRDLRDALRTPHGALQLHENERLKATVGAIGAQVRGVMVAFLNEHGLELRDLDDPSSWSMHSPAYAEPGEEDDTER